MRGLPIEHKKAGLIISIIAIASKCLLMFFFSFVGRDKGLQLAAAKNLLEGHGLTTTVYYLNDLYQPAFLALNMWPPGFSIFISPLLLIFKDNYYLVTSLFDCIFAIFFIIINRKLLRLLNLPYTAINLFTLFSGFFLYNFTSRSYPTDLAALCFFLSGIFFMIKILKEPGPGRYSDIFFAGCFLFFASLFRYMYIPVVIGVAAAALLVSFSQRKPGQLKNVALVFFIILLMTGGMLVLLKIYTGASAYIKKTETGFYLENLTSWFPGGVASFINTDFYCLQAERILNIPYETCMHAIRNINLIIYVPFVLAAAFFVKTFVVKSTHSTADIYIVLGLAAIISLFAELIFLSFTNRAQGDWNYIEGGRYYAFMMLFLQHVFFIWAFRGKRNAAGGLKKIVVILIGFCCGLEVLHGMYFSTKVAFHFSAMKTQIKQEQDYVFFEKLCRKMKRESPGQDIIVASDDEYFRSMASLLDLKGIGDVEDLNHITPRVHKPGVLITVLIKKTRNNYIRYISREDVVFLKKIGDTEFYVQQLRPE